MSEVSKVIDIATAEVGYLEKRTNSNLDSKTANVGYNNYTKYARDMDNLKVYNGKKQGYSWCNIFIDWCFVKALGQARAKELLIGWSAGCTQDWNWFKAKGQTTKTPQVGDLIFFGNLDHIGIVYKVDTNKVYTIEGNTSGATGLVANGGGVAKKSYSKTASYIYGYARPKYKSTSSSSTSSTTNTSSGYTYKQFVKDVQKATGAKVDGIAGKETLSKTVTVSAKKNNRHAVVKPIQKYLYILGYKEVGTADGIAGSKFTTAVKKFQKSTGCVQDGEITARNKTWKKLLKLA